ncbi:MAG: hypothetical protein ACRC7O_13515, partial [Fimbriiglobus sp.]
RDFLKQEIAKPTLLDAGTQPTYVLYPALALLHFWKRAEDSGLLLEYLKHPCRINGNQYEGALLVKTIARYPVREYAKRCLDERGIKIPDGVVYSEVIDFKP